MGKIAEPRHNKLRPEHIEPEQRESGDDDSHTLQLHRLEKSRQIQRSLGDCPEDQDPCGASEHVAPNEIQGNHRAVIMRKQHHSEIPGNEGIGYDGNDQYERRIKTRIGFQISIVAALA